MRTAPHRRRAAPAALLAAALLALVALAPWAPGAAGASVPASRSRLQAFLLAGAPDSLADLRAHSSAIGVLYPTYYECARPGGSIDGADVPAITGYARSQGIAVMPRFNCQDGATVHRILTDPATRAGALGRLAALAARPAYAGLSLDLENDGAGDRAALSSFVTALAARLHAERRRLSVVVDGVPGEQPGHSTYLYDDRALSAAADSVFVLAWGAHWQGSEPGPIAPLANAVAVARYLASLPHASRFVLGAPMYGLDWGAGGGPGERASALQYAGVLALARAVGARPARDRASSELTFSYIDAEGVPHRVWAMDARAVLDVLEIGRRAGLSVGVWRLGSEDQSLWTSPAIG